MANVIVLMSSAISFNNMDGEELAYLHEDAKTKMFVFDESVAEDKAEEMLDEWDSYIILTPWDEGIKLVDDADELFGECNCCDNCSYIKTKYHGYYEPDEVVCPAGAPGDGDFYTDGSGWRCTQRDGASSAEEQKVDEAIDKYLEERN